MNGEVTDVSFGHRTRRALGAAVMMAGVSTFAMGATQQVDAMATPSLLKSFTFAHVPKGYHLSHIAWEDVAAVSTMVTMFPQGIPIISMSEARKGNYIGPMVEPDGKVWYFASVTGGGRGRIVWEFTGPGHTELCATSPLLKLSARGNWNYVKIPMTVGKSHHVSLNHYQWFKSKDGRWTNEPATLKAFPDTPNPRGYSIMFYTLPLDWQLQAFRFTSGHHRMFATVGQVLGEQGTSPYFSEGAAGWSFTYPTKDVSWKGRIEVKFSDGDGHDTWIGTSLKLRG